MRSEQIGRRAALGIAVALSMAPVVGVALGRFGYALLLPAMRSDFGWTYGEAGALGSANAAGYLLGALTTTAAVRLLGARRTLVVSVAGTACTFAFSAVATSWTGLAVLRLAGGVLGAWAYIVGAHLVSSLQATGVRREALIGVYFGGLGVGVAVSGVLVPAVVAGGGWTAGWWALAVLGVIGSAGLTTALAKLAETDHDEAAPRHYRLRAALGPLMVSYLLFGVGYIAYMTFAVAYAAGRGAGTVLAQGQWVVLGVAAVAAVAVWPRLFGWLPGGPALGLILLVQAGAVALLALDDSPPVVLVSAAVFGLTLTSVAGAVTATARAVVPASVLLRTLAALTVIFAIGQVAGPTVFGWVSDLVGLRAGLALSAATLLVGAGFAALQVDDPRQRPVLRSWRPGGHVDLKAAEIRRTSMFALLSPRELVLLCRAGDLVTIAAGRVIDTVGPRPAHIYVVMDGTVAYLPRLPSGRRGPCHVLVAVTDARVLALDRRYQHAVDRIVPGFREQVSVAGTVGAHPASGRR
ncbi:MAG: YbfB/YjiJ family MFS transporter [Pseudonocardia sp.]|nr:YbfB/YjiJ family MFS transporter [Pseudonocardia sp.]